MKKLIGIFIFVILFIFISMYIITYIDKKDINNLRENILKNTDIKKAEYVNKYDDNYLVINEEYLYLFDSLYEEINRVSVDLLHSNENNYQLVYRNNMIMYMDDYKNDDGLVFKYYDIYTYELVDEVVVGDD